MFPVPGNFKIVRIELNEFGSVTVFNAKLCFANVT